MWKSVFSDKTVSRDYQGLWNAAEALYINSDMLLSASSDTENKD